MTTDLERLEASGWIAVCAAHPHLRHGHRFAHGVVCDGAEELIPIGSQPVLDYDPIDAIGADQVTIRPEQYWRATAAREAAGQNVNPALRFRAAGDLTVTPPPASGTPPGPAALAFLLIGIAALGQFFGIGPGLDAFGAGILLFGGISTYLGNELLDHTFKVGAFAQPTNVAISLHSADPGFTGANELPATGAYARVVHNSWDVAAARATENTGAATFPTATADWNGGSNLTHVGLWDAAAAGNFLGGGALTVPKPVLNGDTASFADGALDVTMS